METCNSQDADTLKNEILPPKNSITVTTTLPTQNMKNTEANNSISCPVGAPTLNTIDRVSTIATDP